MSSKEALNALAQAMVPADDKDPTARSQPVTRRKATIDTLVAGATSCTINMSGVLIPGVEWFQHYYPNKGDVVWVDITGKKPIIVGQAGVVFAETQWHIVGAAGEPAFQGTWANLGGGRTSARFRRVGELVVVHAILTGTAVTTAWTMPAGFRPPTHHNISNYNSTLGVFQSDGAIVPYSAASNEFHLNTIYPAFS